MVALGEGRHEVVTYLEHPEHVVPFLKLTLAAGVIYNPALFSTKVIQLFGVQNLVANI